jgi:hypothetical protein
MAFGNGPKIVTDGLVLALDAADRNSYVSGSMIWNDLSGNNNNGSLVNGPTFSTANGGSIVFDGTDDYVSVPKQTAFVNATTFTLAAFMKRRLTNSVVICFQGAVFNNDIAFELWNDNFAYFEVGNGSNSYGYIANTSTNWQYLTMVFDGTQTGNSNRLKCYINGILLGVNYSGTIPATTSASNSVFSIGNSQGIGGNYSDGNIANVQIYNRPLSATEVSQNYNAQKSRFNIA